MERISEENFIKAENKAFEEDMPMREAVKEFTSRDGEIEILEPCKVMELVRPRAHNAHKGTFGKLVFIGGSDRYPGAAQLACMAALRSGVGLVQAVTTVNSAIAMSAKICEATLLPMPADEMGFIDPRGREDVLEKVIRAADAVLIGCGLGTEKGGERLIDLAIENAKKYLIFDADGINLVSRRIECLRKAEAEIILTPHPGELGRLVGASAEDVKLNRFTYAKRLSEEFDAVVVAKSSSTFIVGKGEACLSVGGNSGLSRGGSGDMLAGLISSFAAQGYSPADAAKIGVTLQGACCEAATERLSERGTLPSDILEELPRLFKKTER